MCYLTYVWWNCANLDCRQPEYIEEIAKACGSNCNHWTLPAQGWEKQKHNWGSHSCSRCKFSRSPNTLRYPGIQDNMKRILQAVPRNENPPSLHLQSNFKRLNERYGKSKEEGEVDRDIMEYTVLPVAQSSTSCSGAPPPYSEYN